MSSRIGLALSLLTIVTFLADETPAAAQRETFSLPPSVPTRSGDRESAKPIAVSELVEQLRTADVEERWKIIQQLSDTQQNIVPALVRAMEEPDPLVKSGVAEVLGNLTDDAVPAIPGLIEMMNDGRRAIVPGSSSSGLYLPYIRPVALPPLYPPTNVKDDQQRRLPPTPPQNPENLLRNYSNRGAGKNWFTRKNLCHTASNPSLARCRSLGQAKCYLGALRNWRLCTPTASLVRSLTASDPNLRRSAAVVFLDRSSLLRKVFGAEGNASTTAPLLTALKDDDFTVRNAASQALGLLGTRALPELVQALKAPEPIVRLEAARLVGNLGGAAQSAVPNLLALLTDAGRYVPPSSNRFNFANLPPLNLYSGTDQYPPAPNNPEQLVRVNAAIALGKLGNRNAIPALTTALKDNNPWMQLATGWALLNLGQTQGLPVVGRLVQHPDASIQQEALSQLQRYGSQSAPYVLPYYSARLESADDNDRNGAIIGIGKFGAAALDLVPKLRAMLVGNQKRLARVCRDNFGEIARDTAVAWQNGSLSANQRQQAIAELTKVLNIMQAPNARFNREPIDRVRNALTTLRGVTP
jgi:HEAT repeat protein